MVLLYFVLLLLALAVFVVGTKQATIAKLDATSLGLALVTAVLFLQTLQKL